MYRYCIYNIHFRVFRLAWKISSTSVYLSPNLKTDKETKNRFNGINSASLCGLAGRYDDPIPTGFLASIDCLKIPALFSTGTLLFSFSPRKKGNSLVSSQEARKNTVYFRCEKPGNPTISTREGRKKIPQFFSRTF